MIYWRIKQPGKSWANWSDGTAGDVDEAKIDAIGSLMDDDGELRDFAKGPPGIAVEMWNCIDIDDFRIDQKAIDEFNGAAVQWRLTLS